MGTACGRFRAFAEPIGAPMPISALDECGKFPPGTFRPEGSCVEGSCVEVIGSNEGDLHVSVAGACKTLEGRILAVTSGYTKEFCKNEMASCDKHKGGGSYWTGPHYPGV